MISGVKNRKNIFKHVNNKKHARSKFINYVPISVIFIGFLLFYFFGLYNLINFEFLGLVRYQLKEFVIEYYFLSIIIFFAIYVFVVTLSIPVASVLTIFGGFLFGWIVAGLVVIFAATLGATVLFLAARYAFAEFFRRRIGGRAALLAEGFEKDAFTYLLVLRLAPIFPFFLINIAPALLKISTLAFVAATFIGILPGTFAYAYLGQGVDSVFAAANANGHDVTISNLITPDITIGFAALALVAAIPLIVKNIRKT